MDFNYVLSTGGVNITDSQVPFLERNRRSFQLEYDKFEWGDKAYALNSSGQVNLVAFSRDENIVTGDHTSLLTFNTQTLFEGEEDIIQGGRFPYYSLDSGDYYVDAISGENVFYFDSSLDVKRSDSIYYDKRDFASGVMVYKSSSDTFATAYNSLLSKVNGMYGNAGSSSEYSSNYDTFLNGQKLGTIDSSMPNSVTGKLFSIPKKTNIKEITTDSPDLYGTGFIEYHLDLYLNGMEQNLDDIIQLNTGVEKMIQTGVKLSIDRYGDKINNYYYSL